MKGRGKGYGQREQGSSISVHRVLSFSDVVCKKNQKTTRAFEVRGATSFTKFLPGDGVTLWDR